MVASRPTPAVPGTTNLSGPSPISVVITCHSAYEDFLKEAIVSVDSQIAKPSKKIVVFDGMEVPGWTSKYSNWIFRSGRWGTPNPARNLGLSLVDTPWVVFFDADNIMPNQFLSKYSYWIPRVSSNVSTLYPDIQYMYSMQAMGRKVRMPEFDEWEFRRKNCIDTSSCWKVDAVRSVGGFRENIPSADDYALMLDLLEAGWTAKHAEGAEVLMREHKRGRRSEPMWTNNTAYPSVRWAVSRHLLVTLFAGRTELLPAWADWVQQADLPPRTRLLAVDNSGSAAFSEALREAIPWQRFENVQIRQVSAKPVKDNRLSVLKHVGSMYNLNLAGREEEEILILEDDVVPKTLDAARRLYDVLVQHSRQTALVSAVYESRDHPGRACFARARDKWADTPLLGEVNDHPFEVGFAGVGFAWVSGWVLKKILPLTVDEQQILGWDAVLCKKSREQGLAVVVDGRIKADHRFGPLEVDEEPKR